LKSGSLVLLLMLISHCVMAQEGNKKVITQTRDVATFDGLSISGIFKVIYTQGEPQSVKIETDENLMDKVKTEVHGGILELGNKENFNNPTKINVYITAKNLKSLEMSGATKFTVTNKIVTQNLKVELSGIADVSFPLSATNVNCDLSGATKLELQGTADQLTVDASGTAKLNAAKFEVKNVKADASGAVNVTVNATISVSLDASGVSNIKYVAHDKLQIKSKDVSGVAHIKEVKGDASSETN